MAQRLSIIVASQGRPSLSATLDSAASQMRPGDELLVDVNDDAPWGHAARNRLMPRAAGTHLAFMDDDDRYAKGALDAVRHAIADEPTRVHIFRMRYQDGRVLWGTPEAVCGNVSTQMVVVPNDEHLGRWGDRYEGDLDFIVATLGGREAAWHEEVIALVGTPAPLRS